MKITNHLPPVALWTFVLGTLILSLNAPPAVAVDLENDLFAYWNDRYATGADIFPPPTARPSNRILSTEVLAKAQPDECFYDTGDSANAFNLFSPTVPDDCLKSTGAGDGLSGEVKPGTLKVNQAYVWGMAKAGNTLWFGTGPNAQCLVLGTYLQTTDPQDFDGDENYICEFGESQFADAYLDFGLSEDIAEALGDWRPPPDIRLRHPERLPDR